MLNKTAIAILRHERGKYAGVVCGVALALFLALLQSGFYLGFRRDITIVPDSCEADLWIAPRHLLTLEYCVPFDDAPRWTALSDPEVLSAAGLVSEWVRWRRRTDGATESAFLVGFDFSAGVPMNLNVVVDTQLASNAQLASLLALPGHVLVDQKHLGRAGITDLSELGAELQGKHAHVVGVMHDRKLFSTACLVVTDLDNGRRYIGLPANRVSYLAVKCRPGADVAAVRQRLAAQLLDQDILTAREFHNLTQDYWIRLTGIGPVLLLGAALGALVGFITVFLTFSHLTAEKLPVYAAMKAMGASTKELAGLILSQIALVFAIGALVAVAGVAVALAVLAHTTISVSITSGVWMVGIGSMALCSFAAGIHALRLLAAVEPAEAFKV